MSRATARGSGNSEGRGVLLLPAAGAHPGRKNEERYAIEHGRIGVGRTAKS